MLPVTVLTGFLGAGKTTFLKRLVLSPHGLRIALIINEVGEAGAETLDPRDSTYLELAEGCVCCLKNPELMSALRELHARGDLDRAIIETTGVADPLAITFTLERPDMADAVRLDAVVTVVDTTAFARSDGPEWQQQVAAADLVILSKLDLGGDADAAIAAVRAVNPAARVLRADDPGAQTALLEVWPRAGAAGAPAGRHSGFGAETFAGGTYRLAALEDWLEVLPPEVFRAKGVVDTDEGWAEFHVVAGRVQVDPGIAAPAHGATRMVFIGTGLTRARLEAELTRLRVRG
ncbi:MAG TPA: GTP-binding protein [Haliangiales bacterium]|nr:GTP-binding protein [Haliangiales bacterium]